MCQMPHHGRRDRHAAQPAEEVEDQDQPEPEFWMPVSMETARRSACGRRAAPATK